jgi:hypothetical protein
MYSHTVFRNNVFDRSLRDLEIVRYQRKGNSVLYTLKAADSLREFLERGERYVVKAAGMVERKSGLCS